MGYGNNSGGYRGNRGGGGARGGRSGGYGGRGQSYNSGGDRKPESFSAECADCYARCRVPFKPNGRKPVLCSDCYSKQGHNARSGQSNRLDFDRDDAPRSHAPRSSAPAANNDEIVKQLKALNTKMEQLLQVLTEVAEYDEDEEESWDDSESPVAQDDTLESVGDNDISKELNDEDIDEVTFA